ncbi:hypothetical protein, partial [Brassicibacter mesophilus]|uniref:hypothetical protein n=1 Tax=Brassicibacter mesophilus TaxID=745119 RepID=UPI003D1DC4B1
SGSIRDNPSAVSLVNGRSICPSEKYHTKIREKESNLKAKKRTKKRILSLFLVAFLNKKWYNQDR